jgi:hypothetical protein
LLPYIVASYYERYAVPLLTVKVLLVVWAVDRLLSLGRARRIPATHAKADTRTVLLSAKDV